MDHRFSLELTFFFGVRGLEGIVGGGSESGSGWLRIHRTERDREEETALPAPN
ncbi:hypothetical protein F2Q69_00038498 [Brassica cretica]|uniref:Uncharacterized protein n=1 Tax=Brassica cretica TaxID=69181 RepID=A0A8S9SF90_BRACR|nr:hypothetical protein F2Q69_00038498 [Brassica cretica]